MKLLVNPISTIAVFKLMSLSALWEQLTCTFNLAKYPYEIQQTNKLRSQPNKPCLSYQYQSCYVPVSASVPQSIIIILHHLCAIMPITGIPYT